MEQRIHCAGAETVAVPRKLFDHLQTEYRFFAGVIQDVKANKAGIQLPVRELIRVLTQVSFE